MTARHAHRAVPARRTERCWSGCVRHRECSGVAHGAVTFVDHCRCGAERLTESNAMAIRYGAWVKPDA